MLAVQMYMRLWMFLIKDKGRATNSPRAVKMIILRLELFSSSVKFEIIGGPRSPMTTKNAIVVPTK